MERLCAECFFSVLKIKNKQQLLNLQGSGSSNSMTVREAFGTKTLPPCISHQSCGPGPEGRPIDSASLKIK